MVLTAVLHGHWPSKPTADFLPYYQWQNELTAMDGCLLWGCGIIVPTEIAEDVVSRITC